MPRQPRIDAPGMVHHVIARGIERNRIFLDDKDQYFFIERLGDLVVDTGDPAYAFALIPNHFHLLVRSEKTPIATLMRRLLTAYALHFNRKYGRSGHLFQNRYKSVPCGDEVYFRELIRYIHLNPVRAGLCSFKELPAFRFCGHGSILANRRLPWLDADHVLKLFGRSDLPARMAYQEFIEGGVGSIQTVDLRASGVDSGNLLEDRGRSLPEPGISRIYEKNILNTDRHADIMRLIDRVCSANDVTRRELLGKSRIRKVSNARAELAREMAAGLGMTRSQIAKQLSVRPAAVGKMLHRGEAIRIVS